MNRWLRRIFFAVVGLAALILVVSAFIPAATLVEVGQTHLGPMEVSLTEAGKTRAHERFVVAAPVSGRLARIELREGDAVRMDQGIAWLHLAPLDPREKAEVLARVQAAQAVQREVDKSVEGARANHAQARRELARIEKLAKDGLVPVQSVEQAKIAELTANKELEAIQYRAQASASEVKIAEAGLLAVQGDGASSSLIEIRSPVAGKLLRLLEKNERVVPAGTPLLEIGDPSRLEVVVDVLSRDAVKIQPGAEARIKGWGGEQTLQGRVRTIEPSAFTKISALGIEEQRVNVVVDLMETPPRLGDAYKVDAEIVLWSHAQVLQTPESSVFRAGKEWSVFIVKEGRAHRQPIKIGHRNDQTVEILQGLSAGDPVILHPMGQLQDGMRVKAQP